MRAQIALDHRQRRAQLVGDIGDHVLAQPLGLLERGGHLIKRVRRVGDLGRAGDRHALDQAGRARSGAPRPTGG